MNDLKHLAQPALLGATLAFGFAGPAAFAATGSGNAYLSSAREAAVRGDAKAQYNLGGMYRWGCCGQPDLKQAAYWFRKAAEQGNPDAAEELADMYDRDTPPNEAQAQIWYGKAVLGYRAAAERGDAHAQFVLGRMYRQGQGVAKNLPLAVTWYGKAAEQGHVDAGLELSWMYAHGQGVPRDIVQAYVWLDRFAHVRYGRDATPPGAPEELAALAAQMTPAQLAEAMRLEAAGPPR